jgi:hypothetical protein
MLRVAVALVVLGLNRPAAAQVEDLTGMDQTCLYRDSLGNEFMSFAYSNCFEACRDAERTCLNVARIFPNEYGPNTPKGRALLENPDRRCLEVRCPLPKARR